MTTEDILKAIKEWQGSEAREKLVRLTALYDADNPRIVEQGRDRQRRRKTPNNVVPSAYYPTVIDTMAGYMFQDVQYVAETDAEQANIDAIAFANNFQVKDMKAGIGALAFNKSIEYVYTDDDANIKVAPLSPLNTIILRDNSIEAEPIAAINYSVDDDIYDVLYIEPNLELRFKAKDDKISDLEERTLFFDSLPVIEYVGQILGKKAPFEKIIPYIETLDALISGNANELERLVDALLVLGRSLQDEDLMHMDEWKVLQDMSSEDRAEYLTKDTSPEFRRYVSDLLIREIHKHSHVIDWYSADNGSSQDASGKALRTRLFDMNMFSKRIEMAFREGMQARLKAIGKLADILRQPIGEVKVFFNRTMIDDFIDDAVKLSTVTFISDESKREYLNMDEAVEKERLAAEQPAVVEIMPDDIP